MKHFIVNIGCEYGSGGPDIGRMISESLGIPFYDRDLVDQVVEKLGVDRDLVEKADSGEENVKYEFDTTFGPRYANLTNRVIYTQFEVIHKLAAKSSCVIIGRCSNYILKDRDDCLNIFVYAPDEFKAGTPGDLNAGNINFSIRNIKCKMVKCERFPLYADVCIRI